MTFAWYAHLRNLSAKPWFIAVLVSWAIAFFEYILQVPANRTGITVMQLGQLKILQEVIALSVFVPFSILYMKQRITLDYIWASLCIAGAAGLYSDVVKSRESGHNGSQKRPEKVTQFTFNRLVIPFAGQTYGSDAGSERILPVQSALWRSFSLSSWQPGGVI